MLLITIFIIMIYSSLHNHSNYTYYTGITRIGALSLLYILYIYYDITVITVYDNNMPSIYLYNDLLSYNSLVMYIILLLIMITIWLLFIIMPMDTYKLYQYIYYNNKYMILLLYNIMGIIIVIMSNNLLLLYASIELQSYSLYLLAGLYKESYNSTKSALLYYIIGGIASIMILSGITILYNITGTIYMHNIYILYIYNNIIQIGYIPIIIGLLLKAGIAPLHNWSITVYNNVPTIITIWFGIITKISIMTYIYILYSNMVIYNNNIISYILLLFILLSLLIGSIGGLYQIKIKILLVYSGILNGAYILLTILINNNMAITAYIIYITQYTMTHINIFIILLYIPCILYTYNNYYNDNNNNNNDYNNSIYNNNYSIIYYINQLYGLISINTYIWLSLIISLFSLIGIPPLYGYYGKLYIIISAIDNGYIWCIILLITASALSTLYYIYIIKITTIYDNSNKNHNNVLYNNYNMGTINNNISGFIPYIISIITMILLCNSIQNDAIIKGTTMISILYQYI